MTSLEMIPLATAQAGRNSQPAVRVEWEECLLAAGSPLESYLVALSKN